MNIASSLAPIPYGLNSGSQPPAEARAAKIVDRAKVRDALMAAAKGPDPDLVRSKSTEVMGSPLFKGPDAVKTQARDKLNQVVERLKILKKLYAANPKEMARALAQVFKELKAAIKAYKDAGGRELAMSGAAVSAAFASDGTAAPAKDIDAKSPVTLSAEAPQRDVSQAAAEDAPAQAPPEDASDSEAVAAPASDAAALDASDATPSGQAVPGTGDADTSNSMAAYRSVLTEVRRMIGEDGLEFAKLVRSLSNDLSNLLESARIQTKTKRPEKPTEEAFKDADEGLKAMREEIDAMVSDIHRDAPMAGMRLSITA